MKVITCSVVVEILFISSLDGLVRTELTDQINYYNNGSGDFFSFYNFYLLVLHCFDT